MTAVVAPARIRARRSRPPLSVVRASGEQATPRRLPFILLVAGLLTGGLVLLLMLNTMAAQDAFKVRDLTNRLAQLQAQRQALALSVASQDEPATLAARAHALGLVPAPGPAFLRVSDGAILGDPAPATAPPPPPKPAPKPSASATPGAKPKPGARPSPLPRPTPSHR